MPNSIKMHTHEFKGSQFCKFNSVKEYIEYKLIVFDFFLILSLVLANIFVVLVIVVKLFLNCSKKLTTDNHVSIIYLSSYLIMINNCTK